MRQINEIIIHCSASPNGDSLFRPNQGGGSSPVQVIDGWHATRGFHRSAEWMAKQNPGLKAIGYHFVVYTSGAGATGRHLDEIGAHVAGSNARSIGICMVGTDAYTIAQWATLSALVSKLKADYHGPRICGHRDHSPDKDGDGIIEPWEFIKTCPGFDVATWLKQGMGTLAGHTIEGDH